MIQNLELYKRALDCASNHIIITDLKGIIQYANTAASHVTGYSTQEIIGSTPKLWGGLMDQSFYDDMWKHISQKEMYRGEIRNRRKSGEIYYAEITVSPVFDETGTHVGYIGMEEDISHRKDLESKLRHERDRLSTVVSAMAEGLVVTDLEGNVTFINLIAQKLLGITEKGADGKNIREVLPLYRYEKPIHKNEHPLEKLPEPGSICTLDFDSGYSVKTADKNFAVSLKATTFREKDHAGVVIVFNDATREKEIDQRKTDFISLASHQLRTPLSASKWYLEMLLTGDAGELSTEQKEFTRNIEFSNNRMISLVNSLLNISRIESGRILIEPQPSDVVQLIDELLVDFDREIREKSLEIVKEYSESKMIVESDPKLLTHIFLALLSNAIRYSDKNGSVKISVDDDPENVFISFADQGYGISSHDHDRIFEKFFRGENATKIVTDGSGLGLYLARLIAHELHGTISFDSTIDQGSTFTVSFPKKGLEYRKGEVSLDSKQSIY